MIRERCADRGDWDEDWDRGDWDEDEENEPRD